MTTSAPSVPALAATSASAPVVVRRIFWANLVANIAIIITGGIVRLSGSGLGCPTWPECVPGSFVPVHEQAQGWHKAVEFGNRTLTGLLLALAIAVVWAVLARLPHRPSLRRPAWLVLAGIIAQAVIGGITVLTGLSPITVGVHFLVSAWLVGLSMWLVLALDRPEGRLRWGVPRIGGILAILCGVVGMVVLALGTVVTGSGPHAGDADKPVRYAFDPRTVAWLHADAVMVFTGLVIGLWVLSSALKRHHAARAWGAVTALTVAQGILGYVQYVIGVPPLMVLAHMALAGLLVCGVTHGIVALLDVDESPHPA